MIPEITIPPPPRLIVDDFDVKYSLFVSKKSIKMELAEKKTCLTSKIIEESTR